MPEAKKKITKTKLFVCLITYFGIINQKYTQYEGIIYIFERR